MTVSQSYADIRVGPQGRIVIPAPLRRALGVESGDSLLARVQEHQLIIEKQEAIEARLLESFRQFEGRSLADELIAERRNEARKEDSQ